jgi:tRNA threonylcarbamoyl adenosine modification protein (Sua5/YciO/YrdC/YwlC family)
MARYFDVHPHDPQPRALGQIAAILRDSGVIAYPTDSCYALGCLVGHNDAVARIRRIRRLDEQQPLALVCADMQQLGSLVQMDNRAFRAIRASTPGPYTFILPAARGVPRRLADPKRRSIGVRIPASPFARALLAELGEPLVSSSLVLPDDDEPMSDGWEIKERLDHEVDAVVEAGECRPEASTVVDWTSGDPQVVRVGVGDPSRFA